VDPINPAGAKNKEQKNNSSMLREISCLKF